MDAGSVVILSHWHDAGKVYDIQKALIGIGYYVVNDADTTINSRNLIHHNSGPGGTVLVVLSHESSRSEMLLHELPNLLQSEIEPRGINLVCVKLDRCKTPDYLYGHQLIDCFRDFRSGLEKLLTRMEMAKYVNLKRLNSHEFEDLAIELLKSYGFRSVKRAT